MHANSNSNYNQSSDTTKYITINKANPTGVSASVQTGTYYIGNALSTVGILGSSPNVSGSFAWSSPSTTLTASGTYQWKFTPNDTTNYNEVTGNLTVTAVAPLTRIEVSGGKTTYNAYEAFTTAGITVTAYGNGSKTVSIDDCVISVPYGSGRNYFLVSDSGCSVTVSYTESGTTKSATIPITVNKVQPQINVSGVKTNYTYNGSLQTVSGGATVTPSEQTVKYSNNTFTTVAQGNGLEVNVYVEESANCLPASATVTITVSKAKYDMTNVSWNYSGAFTYAPNVTRTVTLTNLPAGVGVRTYSDNSFTDAGDYIASVTEWTYDTVNYEEPTFRTCSWKINKATPEVVVNVSSGTYYIGEALGKITPSLVSSTVSGALAWTYPTNLLTGEYVEYDWTFTPNPEYRNNYNNATGKYAVTAVYKVTGIEVTKAKSDYTAFDEYDEAGTEITATYLYGKNPAVVTGWSFAYPRANADCFTVEDNGKQVVFTYVENGVTVTCNITVTVGKKTVDMSGISMTDKTETYTGEAYSVEISGELDADVIALTGYKYNGVAAANATNAGTYEVEAVFALIDPDNYIMPELSATLTINKASVTVNTDGVNKTYTYNGEEQTVAGGVELESDAVVKSNQTVKYRNNKFTTVAEGNALQVVAYVEESENFLAAESAPFTITVNKSEVTLTWEGGNGVYDGKEHNATLTVADGVYGRDASGFTTDTLKSQITVTYTASEGGTEDRTHVGEYAPAYTGYPEGEPFCNYFATVTNPDYTFEITKDSVAGLSFEDKEFGYDGKGHTITITGTLPAQVTVKYYIDGTVNEFTDVTDVKRDGDDVAGYLITAIFACESGNYEVPENLEATLTITPRTITDNDVSGIEKSYIYKGEAWTPEPEVALTLTGAAGAITLSKDRDYSLEYSTSDYIAGTSVDVTVAGKGNYTGTVTKTFEITKSTISMKWIGNEFTYTGEAQGITAEFSGIAASDAATVAPTVTYTGRGDTNYNSGMLPVNAGYYKVTVEFVLNNDNYINTVIDGDFRNFEIKKAQLTPDVGFVTYDPSTSTPKYAGEALPEIEVKSPVMFNGKLIKGATEWQKVGSKPATARVGTNDYIWVFTPEDGENFAQSTGKLTVVAVAADIESISWVWNTADGAQPELFTSTTLEKVREYLTVTGVLGQNLGTIDVADYTLVGSWGSGDNPAKADVYILTITTADEKFSEAISGVVYKEVLITGITVTTVDGSEHKKSYTAFDTFDKTKVIVTAEYNDGAKVPVTDYGVTYPEGRDCFWAKENEYQALTITYGDYTYEITGITVLKKTYDTKGITFESEKTETYDGANKAYAVKGVFDIGKITYTYAKWDGEAWISVPGPLVNAGRYRITAHFEITDEEEYTLNYNGIADMESVLTIKKASFNLDDMVFADVDCDYAYGASVANKVSVQNVPAGVTKVEYVFKDETGKTLTADEVVNAGTYTVSVKFEVDDNHEQIALDPVKFTIKKIRPAINPTVSGSLTTGTRLYQLTIVADGSDVAGTYAWVNDESELTAGINRCGYVFTPEDTRNFETVTGHIDLTVGAVSPVEPVNGGTLSGGAIAALVIGMCACLFVAVVALIIAVKVRKAPADSDGFYDDATEDDLKG